MNREEVKQFLVKRLGVNTLDAVSQGINEPLEDILFEFVSTQSEIIEPVIGDKKTGLMDFYLDWQNSPDFGKVSFDKYVKDKLQKLFSPTNKSGLPEGEINAKSRLYSLKALSAFGGSAERYNELKESIRTYKDLYLEFNSSVSGDKKPFKFDEEVQIIIDQKDKEIAELKSLINLQRINPEEKKPFTVAYMRDIEKRLIPDSENEISYSRMVELLNEKAFAFFIHTTALSDIKSAEEFFKAEVLNFGFADKESVIPKLKEIMGSVYDCVITSHIKYASKYNSKSMAWPIKTGKELLEEACWFIYGQTFDTLTNSERGVSIEMIKKVVFELVKRIDKNLLPKISNTDVV